MYAHPFRVRCRRVVTTLKNKPKFKEHLVKPSECFASIAKQYGFADPDTLYHHPANVNIRALRANKHLLEANDIVYIPAVQERTVSLMAGKQTVLVLKGKVCLFNLEIAEFDGKPLANTAYLLEVAKHKYTGTTDTSGKMTQVIDSGATTGKLWVYLDENKHNSLFWTLQFGMLTPCQSMAGIQARLNNLGYYCANEKGKMDSSTQDAITQFKLQNNLPPSPEIDELFLSTLIKIYRL